MTDPEEFDFDWNARHNAKPLDGDPIREAIGREAAVMIDSKDKHTFMRELGEKAREQFEREQKRLEMFPELIQAFADLKVSFEISNMGPLRKFAQPIIDAADQLLERARALLP